jgi:ureidoglycolate dehydrogenase (NAD+)
MPQIRFDSRVISSHALVQFCTDVFIAAGLPRDDAELTSQSLVESNLRGVDSHGVARVPHYLDRIRHGSINPRPNLQVETLAPAAARVDGDRGLGQLAMSKASEVAIDLARQAGAGWVTVANSSHCGALAFYGLKIADAGMIGLVFTHVDPMVIPFGAKRPFCGTNPLCITAPRAAAGAGDRPTGALCLDMATSITPWNSVANAAIEGVPIPEGWGVDRQGHDTTNPEDVEALYPFGGYKGSGLGMVIDVLCAMLSGAPFGPDIPKMYDDDLTKPRHLGGLIGAIEIGRFVPREVFFARVADMIGRWGALPPSEPDGRVLYPGEPELICRERRLKEGIPMGVQTLKEFDLLADRWGIERLGSDGPLVDGPVLPARYLRPASAVDVSQHSEKGWK